MMMIRTDGSYGEIMRSPIAELAETYPQLYLDPDRCSIDEYKAAVLSGDRPLNEGLSHFACDGRDRAERIATPAGEALVVTLYNRRDFETFVRCMMAAKEGPERAVPATMGASTLTAFNWPRIFAHRDAFMKAQLEAGVEDPDWGAEFRRFTSVKENYIDTFIVLSRGPYSNVSAQAASSACGTEMSEEDWTEKSDAIRKYHELTHFVCRKLYPDMIDAVWDELVADAVGLYAAYGRFDPMLERRFLGIDDDGRYTGGRLGNYTDTPEALTGAVCAALERVRITIENQAGAEPFALIGAMMSAADLEEAK